MGPSLSAQPKKSYGMSNLGTEPFTIVEPLTIVRPPQKTVEDLKAEGVKYPKQPAPRSPQPKGTGASPENTCYECEQKYAKLVDEINIQLDGIKADNFRSRADNLRKIANMSEPFQSANLYVSGCDGLLIRKNEQICTLIVVIIVLITAFILLGCYLFMHRSTSTSGTKAVSADNT